ncbi:MAG: methyl-accepting chemotaxis protein [Candidatus Omnitrophota bacterium]|nr:methyl-accepting chemotaxis protein [Candidatus Omnitrophota bacterium]
MAAKLNRPVIKRKHYLISRYFQLKYIGLILMLMFLTAALCSYVVYYSTMLLVGEKLANVYPQGRLMAIVNTVNFRILITMLLITPLVALIGILLSHKIAGPIYRIEQVLGSMASGDLTAHIVLRKGDELTGLADHINTLTDSIKSAVRIEKERLNAISNEMNELRRLAASIPYANNAINRVDKKLNDLEKELNKYKI